MAQGRPRTVTPKGEKRYGRATRSVAFSLYPHEEEKLQAICKAEKLNQTDLLRKFIDRRYAELEDQTEASVAN